MACNITLAGIGYDCEVNIAGIKTLYMQDWEQITSSASSQGLVTLSGSFMKYVPSKNSASLTKTLTKNEETGVLYYTSEIVANFNKMDETKRQELDAIGRGRLFVVAEDKNGKFWVLGDRDESGNGTWASATAITGQTGAGPDDGNFYGLTIQYVSAQLPYTSAEAPTV